MATVGARVELSFKDHLDIPASTVFYANADDTATLADLVTAAQAYVTNVAPLTDDGIVSARVSFALSVAGVDTPASDSESEQGLLTNFNQAGVKYPQAFWIPGLKDSLVVNGKVDLSATAIVNFTNLIAGTIGGIFDSVSAYDLQLPSLRDMSQSFRKLRRRSSKITKATP